MRDPLSRTQPPVLVPFPDFLKKTTCEVQAFVKAVQLHRQEKGHYESWDMLIGSDVQVGSCSVAGVSFILAKNCSHRDV